MKIAIVGAGGIGGYLTAKLETAGTRVALLARGEHLAAMQRDGLRLIDPEGDLTVRPDALTDNPEEIGTPDLIILATKAHQLAEAIEQIKPAVGESTRVLTFQNGVDAPDMVAETFGRGRALMGVALILANITAPGVITRYGKPRAFIFGDMDGQQDPVADIREVLTSAGIMSANHPDVRVALWEKLVLFNAGSSITAGTRLRVGEIRKDPAACALARRLMEETYAVAVASGVPLPEDTVDKQFHVFKEVMPPEARTSTAHDLEGGRPLEIDFLCGAIARRGRELGLDVSASETAYALLSPWKNGR
ncbi:MAG: 2-dehydropantoate 2-reductase [Pseudomonadota bacterium]